MAYDAVAAPVESLETLAINGRDITGDDDVQTQSFFLAK